MNLQKMVLIGLIGSAMLAACSSSDDDSSSTGSEMETPVMEEATTNSSSSSSIRLPDPDPSDNCIINNVVLSPPSGSTISLREINEIVVSIDFELLNDISDFDLFINLQNQSLDDFAGSSELNPLDLDAGRHVKNFSISISDAPSDNYTLLRITDLSHIQIMGCQANIQVDYVISQ